MAVAVPIIMSAMGAGTVVTAITTVAFAVTGISEKINKAASKVFGEDLVKIGNLFGTAYMAFGGAFGESAGGTAGETLGKAALDGTDAFGANSVSNAFNLGDMAGAAADAGATAAADFAQGTLDQANAIAEMGGDAGEFLAASSPQAGGTGFNLASGDGLTTQGTSSALPSTDAPPQIMPTEGATGAQAGVPRAAGANAAASRATAAMPTGGGATAAPRSFFDQLIYSKSGEINPAALRMGGNLLSGLGQGYQAAQAEKNKRGALEAQMAEERRRQNQSTGTRVTR